MDGEQRTAAAPVARPGALAIQPYVGGKAHGEGDRPAAKLSANESPLGPSPRAMAALRDLAPSLHRYPDGDSLRLRQTLGAWCGRDPGQILCGAGSDELISLLLLAFAGPGDEVVHTKHGFLMYRLSALAVGATPVAAADDGMHASVDGLLAAVTPRTKIVFLANPNNPTGTYLPAAEIARLHAGLPGHVLLVLDGAYTEYVDAGDYTGGLELVDRHPNVVVLRTFSKLFGLAALRLGWCYGPAAIIDVLNRVRGPFNVSAAAQIAGAAAVEDTAHQAAAKAHNDRWLPWLADRLTAAGVEVIPSVANFLLLRLADQTAATTILQRLEADGILARAMGGYGLPDCIRLSVGVEAENRQVVASLEAATAGRPR